MKFLTKFSFLLILFLWGKGVFAGYQLGYMVPGDTLIVKGDYDYAPFEFINSKGQPDGFNVELFKNLANQLGLAYRIELVPWEQAVIELEKGRADVLLGMMISSSRMQRVDFTVPHSFLPHGIFTRKNSNIQNLEDLKGKEVIVQKSDRMHEFLLEKNITDKIITVNSQLKALSLLNSGYHDAALAGHYQGLHLIRSNDFKNIELRSTDIEPQKYALAVKENDKELLALLNMGLYQLKASGQYDEIYEKWLGVYEEEYFFSKNYHTLLFILALLLILAGSVIFLRYRIYKTTKHLQESEARYRSIFQSKHIVMLVIDPENGNIVDANLAASSFYGWPLKQLTSMNINQINTLTQQEIDKEMFRAKKSKDNFFIFRHRLANNDIRDVEVYSGSIKIKKKTLLLSIVHDVTENRKAQEEIKNWQNLLQFIISNAPSGLIVLDRSLRFVYFSERFLQDFEIDKPDILGRTPFEVMPRMDKKWKSIYKEALKGKVIKNDEDTFTRKDGTVEFIRWQCRPWETADGAIGGIILYSEVITERKKSEELRYNLEVAKKTTQIKQTFLANISHEMRTPLNGIIGLSKYLTKSSLNHEQLHHLNIIVESSHTLLDLINQVLNLSKLESGKIVMSFDKVVTMDVVQRLKSSFNFQFIEKGVDLKFEVSENFPEEFVYDEKQLMQVITNLVSNALKFTEKGEVKVKFEKNIRHGDEHLLVSVVDTGQGIAREYHESIFHEFIQVHNSNEYSSTGTGLGLPISRRIVESFGGEMGVISEAGKGSTFWFSILPTKILPPQETKQEEPKEKQTPLGYKVLVVEDKKVNLIVVKLLLEDFGCIVESAENGLAAIEKIKQKEYDIVLMDIQMPVMDGVTATRKLRSMNIDLPPIIGLSAAAMEGDAEKYIKLGLDDYLTKPIDGELLYKKMIWHKKEKLNKN